MTYQVALHICPRCDVQTPITAANEWFQQMKTIDGTECACGLHWYYSCVQLQLSDQIDIAFNSTDKQKEPNTTTIARWHKKRAKSSYSKGYCPTTFNGGPGAVGATGPVGYMPGASGIPFYGVASGFSAAPSGFPVKEDNDQYTFDGLLWKITEDEANRLMDRVFVGLGAFL
jgi:hypothetical protein